MAVVMKVGATDDDDGYDNYDSQYSGLLTRSNVFLYYFGLFFQCPLSGLYFILHPLLFLGNLKIGLINKDTVQLLVSRRVAGSSGLICCQECSGSDFPYFH